MICKYCQSNDVVKNGMKGEKQRYLCNDCGHKFIEAQIFQE